MSARRLAKAAVAAVVDAVEGEGVSAVGARRLRAVASEDEGAATAAAHRLVDDLEAKEDASVADEAADEVEDAVDFSYSL